MNKLILGCLTAALLLTTQPLLAAARVAVLHLAPFASEIDDTAVDIYINGNLTFEGVKYKDLVTKVLVIVRNLFEVSDNATHRSPLVCIWIQEFKTMIVSNTMQIIWT